LASGIAPVIALKNAGVPVSLAVDGAGSNEAADMLQEAHAAWLMARARAGQKALPQYTGGRGEEGADSVTVEDIIHWGTAGGAEVLGLGNIGLLEPGKEADLAIYKLDKPRNFGIHDLSIAPVICGDATLRALLVGGEVIVENGKIPGLDLEELANSAKLGVDLLKKSTI
jgi:cytosine/adenosine deaminase-related metal-dependent hydrolase